MNGRFLKAALATLALGATVTAMGAPISFTGSGTGPGGVGVAALATFDVSGNVLTITLQNTSLSNNGFDVPGSTLTGLFFDLTGNPTLTPTSAVVSGGSSIVHTCDVVSGCSTNVAGEFGYQETSFPGSADRGIASSGYLTTGIPGNIGNFNNGAAGTNLDGVASVSYTHLTLPTNREV